MHYIHQHFLCVCVQVCSIVMVYVYLSSYVKCCEGKLRFDIFIVLFDMSATNNLRYPDTKPGMSMNELNELR